jgi:hypothetical protein
MTIAKLLITCLSVMQSPRQPSGHMSVDGLKYLSSCKNNVHVEGHNLHAEPVNTNINDLLCSVVTSRDVNGSKF